ncbi:MAG: hypothetical protein ACE5OR_10380, partial [bacterium]
MARRWRQLKKRIAPTRSVFLGIFLLVFIFGILFSPVTFALGRREKGSDEAPQPVYPFELIPDWELAPVEVKPEQVRVADVNGDGEIDLLCGYPSYFQVRDISGGVFCQVNIYNIYRIGECLDIDDDDDDDDGELEIFVTVRIKDTFFLHVYDRKGTLLKRIETVSVEDVRGSEGWDGTCEMLALADVNGDGAKDLITRVNAGFDGQPRGIFVYDFQTGLELWRFLMGTSPNELILGDINNDGFQEIVVPTSSPENGSNVNGTNDSTSYVIALSNSGG